MAETGGGLPPIANTEEDRIRTSHPSSNRNLRFRDRVANYIQDNRRGCLIDLIKVVAAGAIAYGVWSITTKPKSEFEETHRTTPLHVTSELENIVVPEYKLREILLEKEPYRVFALEDDETVRPYGKQELLNRDSIIPVTLRPRSDAMDITERNKGITSTNLVDNLNYSAGGEYALQNITFDEKGNMIPNNSGKLKRTRFEIELKGYQGRTVVDKSEFTQETTLPQAEVPARTVDFNGEKFWAFHNEIEPFPGEVWMKETYIRKKGAKEPKIERTYIDGEQRTYLIIVGEQYMPRRIDGVFNSTDFQRQLLEDSTGISRPE